MQGMGPRVERMRARIASKDAPFASTRGRIGTTRWAVPLIRGRTSLEGTRFPEEDAAAPLAGTRLRGKRAPIRAKATRVRTGAGSAARSSSERRSVVAPERSGHVRAHHVRAVFRHAQMRRDERADGVADEPGAVRREVADAAHLDRAG